MTLEEKKEQVKNFRPIDDTFFEVLADDIGVCQEMLRIILEEEKNIIKDVIEKSSEINIYKKSVHLDALCIAVRRHCCHLISSQLWIPRELMNHLVYSAVLGENFGGYKLLGVKETCWAIRAHSVIRASGCTLYPWK